jgi:hypothetical protein
MYCVSWRVDKWSAARKVRVFGSRLPAVLRNDSNTRYTKLTVRRAERSDARISAVISVRLPKGEDIRDSSECIARCAVPTVQARISAYATRIASRNPLNVQAICRFARSAPDGRMTRIYPKVRVSGSNTSEVQTTCPNMPLPPVAAAATLKGECFREQWRRLYAPICHRSARKVRVFGGRRNRELRLASRSRGCPPPVLRRTHR